MIVSEGRGEGESGCEGVRVWGAAHLVRLAPALAVGAKAAAAGILGLLERRRIRRIRRELAATIGSIVLQHMDPPCALRRERGALYHLVLPVVLGQELDIFCGIAISLPSRRLGLAGLTGTTAGAGGGVHSSGSSGSESPQNCFICLASVPTRERAPPSGIWQKSHASFRLRWPLAISSAAATAAVESAGPFPGCTHSTKASNAERPSRCWAALLVGGCPRKPIAEPNAVVNASLQHAAGLSTTGEVLFAQPAEHVCSLVCTLVSCGAGRERELARRL